MNPQDLDQELNHIVTARQNNR